MAKTVLSNPKREHSLLSLSAIDTHTDKSFVAWKETPENLCDFRTLVAIKVTKATQVFVWFFLISKHLDTRRIVQLRGIKNKKLK